MFSTSLLLKRELPSSAFASESLQRETGQELRRFWDWLANKKTLAAVSVLGIFATGAWAIFIYVLPSQKAPDDLPNVNANGSVVANNINNSTITVGAAPSKEPSLIRAKVVGIWGEKHCQEVSYRLSITGQALILESLKRPPNTRRYRFVGTILSDKDNELQVRGEVPDQAYGSSATLSYQTNGEIERLVWTDHGVDRTPVIFNRCT